MRKYKIIFLGVLTVCFTWISHAQTSTSSPYSRYGLGDLQSSVITEYSALGGGATALNQPAVINPYNPASYAKFPSNRFLFSTGLSHLTIQMKKENISQVTNNTSLSHILLGFPISKKIGFSAGLIPYSTIGYNLNSSSDIYNANMIYKGDGGISKIYFGGGVEIIDNLSVGVNASYLFGVLNRRKKVEFAEEGMFNTRSNSSINLRGYYYELGLIYEYQQKNNHFTFGLNANNYNPEINAKRTVLNETFEYSGSYENVKDTTFNSVQSGSARLPKFISIGMSLENRNNLLFVFDYSMQNWSEYRLFNDSDSLENTMRISAGIQFIPDPNSFDNYFKRIKYRLGFSLSNSPLDFVKESAKNSLPYEEKSITFGLGLPVRNSRHEYNLFIELGQRGTTNNNLIKENYARMGLSITFMGEWFKKQKYD